MPTNQPNRRIAVAQFNPTVGDLAGNARQIVAQAEAAVAAGASLLLTPELALCGYPPEDLALREDFYSENARVLAGLMADLPAGLTVVVGYPESAEGRHYNSAVVLRDGRRIANYRKQRLPNYAVFDEMRTFVAGDSATVFDWAGLRCGLVICEDVWSSEPAAQARAAGAEVLLALNASPFHLAKQGERYAVARARVAEIGLPLVYVNMVGGQDELVLDGASFALDVQGRVTAQAAVLKTELPCLDWRDRGFYGAIVEPPDETAQCYQALVLGVRDYCGKNGFKGALLGLSGGIDSALTLCVAVDALGADQVHAVMMPSEYTADMSLQDAEALAKNLGVRYSVHPIKPLFDAFTTTLAADFSGLPFDTTEENLQARVRGVLLMALSNKFGQIVLTTGNKSEMATGYATLYGDMAGGLAVLKDVTKMRVWALSRYRNSIGNSIGNTLSAVIPERIITRPPSAELRPDQCDQDSLPPYDILDDILERYMEAQQSPAEIVAAGHDRAVVERVVRLIDLSEYKRRQSPPGIRITQRGFGRDRRYPITNRYKAPF
ncbi:MAG: NAD+ synthase [Betaproteobacteria bacterium]|nr:MAG: NAD+ synthase [Betaproteobacteria bacterium]